MGSPAGTAPALDHARHGCEVELIAEPRDLSQERADALNENVADLAWRACGGEAGRDDPNVGRGWREYCTAPGGRAQDHDRLVLFWDGDKMVGFNGLVVSRIEPGGAAHPDGAAQPDGAAHPDGATLLWWRAAGTDPAYQARGIFGTALSTMLDPDWLTSFDGPTYWVYRTPNPVIHESVRKWWRRYPDWAERLYPAITTDAELEPIDPVTRAIATHIATALWPDCEFDPATFVIKDFLDKYGRDIWRVPPAESSNPGANSFFRQHLRPGNQDALLGVCLIAE
ncbi:MAG: hypothetical protein QOJ57_1400 [Thermoleophilaceae bacterium]|nr:hypothetical protein [Thermoleophilaceae bacterium]